MGIWDKYKTKNLPEEQRVEVIKHIVSETEQTKRAVLSEKEKTKQARTASNYLWFKGITVLLMVAAIIVGILAAHDAFQDKYESEIKSHQPVVCPPPPAAVPPVFDIRVIPIPRVASSQDAQGSVIR